MVEKHYRRLEVEELTGFSRSAIYELMSKGEFPRPVRIGKRAVAWPESKLAQWMKSRASA